tara:strand:- start:755 stop:1411 length:657 start_codon:yes stop_codon:yes gene_type:complete
MFGLGSQSQQNNGMNLSQSHGSMGMGAQQSPFSLGAQPMQQQQQQGFMGSMMGGMGMTPQQQMMAQQGQMTPPSEMELMGALLQSQNPIHRFIKDGGLANLVDLIAATTSLSLMNILKTASFVIDDEEGCMRIDSSTLPAEIQTLSIENVSMILNNMTAQSNQKIQEAEMQRQQIFNMSQQSVMGGALSAAMMDEGVMNKVGGGVGSIARGLIGLPRN